MKKIVSAWQQFPAYEKRFTFSTLLTLARMVLIPVLITMVLLKSWGYALVVLSFAAISDVLDGYFARLWADQTVLGALLDALADKLLTVGSFSALVIVQRLPVWFFLLAFGKEFLQIVGVGSILYRYQTDVVVQATWLGKAAMVGQTILISWVLLVSWFVDLPVCVEPLLLVCVSFIMIASLFYYAYIGLHYYMCGDAI